MRVPIAEASFRAACARFATGVAVASLRDAEGEPRGLTVSSFTSVSLEPPLVLVSIGTDCSLLGAFRGNAHFAINVLEASQRSLSIRFAEKPERRFDGVGWRAGVHGSPLLEGAIAAIECRTANVIEAGDHTIIFGEVVETELRDGEPLLYYNRSYRRLG